MKFHKILILISVLGSTCFTSVVLPPKMCKKMMPGLDLHKLMGDSNKGTLTVLQFITTHYTANKACPFTFSTIRLLCDVAIQWVHVQPLARREGGLVRECTRPREREKRYFCYIPAKYTICRDKS